MSVLHPGKTAAIYSVLANAIPLYGVLFWGWDIFMVFVLFWFENVMIGVFNVAQMLAFGMKRIVINKDNPFTFLRILFICAFFTVHYGLFTMGHGVFVFALFGDGDFQSSTLPPLSDIVAVFVQHNLLWAALGIILACAFTAVRQFEKSREELDVKVLMFAPYGRIIILHVVLIVGGLLAEALGAPIWALILLIIMKSAYDLAGLEFSKNKDKPADNTI